MKKIFLALLLASIFTSFSFAAIPEQIGVQGKLTDSSGNAITTATSVTFSLYNVASGGTAFYSDNVSVTPDSSGIFNVILGKDTESFSATSGMNFNVPYWLEIKIGSTLVGSRQPMNAAPYAITAKNVTGGTVTVDSVTASSSTSIGVTGASSVNHGAYGVSTASGKYGVYGVNEGSGSGVYGEALSSGYGMYSKSSSGTGIYAESITGRAGDFQNNSSSMQGIRVNNRSGCGILSTGATFGGSFEATGASGIGVSGTSINSFGVRGISGLTHGVIGYASAAYAAGVTGSNTNASGYGVLGTDSEGRAVYGLSDTGTGVYGESSSGVGVYGSSLAAGNINKPFKVYYENISLTGLTAYTVDTGITNIAPVAIVPTIVTNLEPNRWYYKPSYVDSCFFDVSTGQLTLNLNSGLTGTCRVLILYY